MSQGGFDLKFFMLMAVIAGIFYIIFLRPEQKKLNARKTMLEGIRRGDKVITNGGVIGVVVKLTSDAELLVEIAEGVRVRIMRSFIADVPAKLDAPANTDETPKKKKTEK